MQAGEENVGVTAGEQGETACVVLPPHHDETKECRGELQYDNDEEGALEWNLLRDLPYVAFRHLLDFLSSSATGNAGVPELCHVRAESEVFVGELAWGDDVAPSDKEGFKLRMEAQEQQLRSLRPYHAPPKHRDSMGSVAALRLTCHAIKNAVDHALGASAQASALYAPFDQFLIDHSPTAASSAGSDKAVPSVLPLTEAACNERLRKMADLTLGVAQARLHQSRLDEVLEYVWRSWEFAPAKLDALRQQLLAPRASGEAPLLKVEYLRREDDYLGRSYGLGIRACLSLGLPDMPHERAEVGLWVLQAWDHRDEGWDLQVFVDLRTSSPSWKHHLKFSGQDQHDEDKKEEKAEQQQQEEEEEGGEDDEASAPLHVVVFDSYRSHGEIMDQTTANFTLLRKLWQCVGLGGGGNGGDDGSGEDHSWKGKEVLTTLLACLGFAWHDDVDLLWEDCDDEDADAINEHVAGIGRGGSRRPRRMPEVQNAMLLKTSRFKHKELLQGLAPYAAQLNAFLDARQQSAATEAKVREQVVRHVRRFIGQQTLAPFIRQLQGGAYWSSSCECPEFALAHAEDRELRVVYARTLKLEPSPYSDFSDHTVEFAFPVSADALRRVGLADDDGDDHGHHQAGPLPLEVVVRVSTKSANSYTEAHEQSMVTARVVGHHPRLSAALAAKAVAVPNTAMGLEGHGKAKQPDDARAKEPERQYATQGFAKGKELEDEDTVVLQLDRTISDMGRSEEVMATEAIELVGRLLGLSLRPTTSTSDTTTDPDGTGEPQAGWSRGHNPDPAMETTPFAEAVLAFLHEVERVATWDADEGRFPALFDLWQNWDPESDAVDDDDGYDDYLSDDYDDYDR